MAVTLSANAAKHIQKHIDSSDAIGLRLGVKQNGCSGWAYVVDYAEEIKDTDDVFDSHGVKVIVDREALAYLDGTEMDYVQQGLNSVFKFNNPQVKDECGCGESFSV